jgi:hypothetical protein
LDPCPVLPTGLQWILWTDKEGKKPGKTITLKLDDKGRILEEEK